VAKLVNTTVYAAGAGEPDDAGFIPGGGRSAYQGLDQQCARFEINSWTVGGGSKQALQRVQECPL